MEKTEGEVLFLNLNEKGHLMVPGRERALDLVASGIEGDVPAN